MIRNTHTKGFTTIELFMVITLLGVITAFAVTKFSSFKEKQVLENTVIDIVTNVNKASSKTLASVNSSSYGVHFQSDKIVVFTGTTYSSGAGTNETTNVVSPATISSITLNPGGVSDVYFNRLTGIPNVTGTIVVTTPSYSKTITIGQTGTVSVS